MSEALFAGLPRFDDRSASARPVTSWRRELDGIAPHEPADAQTKPERGSQQAEPTEIARTEAPAVEPAPQALDFRKIETSLLSLNSRLDKIERDAQAQTLQSIQSLAAKLFPELSRAFLAEEISRHLATLVPASAAVVEIRAETTLAEPLRDLVERSPALAHRCTVTPVAAEGQGSVDVSWQTGGLSFDFDGLLKASLSHLTSTHSASKE